MVLGVVLGPPRAPKWPETDVLRKSGKKRRGDKEGGSDPLVFQACGRSCMRSVEDTSRGLDQDEVTLHANHFILAWRSCARKPKRFEPRQSPAML